MIKKSFLNGWQRIGIFLLLVPIFAKADWTKIVKTADQASLSAAEYSIDISTVLKDKGYTRVWVLTNYNYSQLSKVNYQNYYSAKNYWEIDCRNKKFRALSISYFSKKNGDGDVVELYNYDPPTSWAYFAPGEIVSYVVNYVCR